MIKTITLPISVLLLLFASCNTGSKDNNINVQPPEEGVHAAFYNSDGSRISISTTKGRLVLTDSSLRVLKKGEGHPGHANSSFFSLDDKYIITGGVDKKLKVWNAATLESERQFDFDFNSWTSIHGYTTLGGCGEKGKVIFYDKQKADTIRFLLEPQGAFHLYYTRPDTSFVVSSGLSGYELDLKKRSTLHKYVGHKNWVYCIMPSNDLKRIITASKDSSVKIFDRFSEKCRYTSKKLDGAVFVSCFTNGDQGVAASTSKGSIYLMDTSLSVVRLKIKAFNTRINTIHCSPNGRYIVAGSEGGGAKIFSLSDGRMIFELKL